MSSQVPAANNAETVNRILSVLGLGLIPHKFPVTAHGVTVELDYLPTVKLLQKANEDGHITVGEAIEALQPLAVPALALVDLRVHGVPIDLARPFGVLSAAGADGNIKLEELGGLVDFVADLARAALVQQHVEAARVAAVASNPALAALFAPATHAPIPAVNTPAPVPVSGGGSMQQLTKLTPAILFGERKRGPSNDGARFDPKNEAQGVDDRLHFDCTPTPDDPAENEKRVGADGNPKKPWVEPRWGTCNEDGSNERLMWNSHDQADKFSLESWEKKGPQDTSGPGLTPVLLLNEEIGPGRTKCFLYFEISAEHNQGHALDGSDRDACPRVYWMAS